MGCRRDGDALSRRMLQLLLITLAHDHCAAWRNGRVSERDDRDFQQRRVPLLAEHGFPAK